jgi:hypothetical protein
MEVLKLFTTKKWLISDFGYYVIMNFNICNELKLKILYYCYEEYSFDFIDFFYSDWFLNYNLKFKAFLLNCYSDINNFNIIIDKYILHIKNFKFKSKIIYSDNKHFKYGNYIYFNQNNIICYEKFKFIKIDNNSNYNVITCKHKINFKIKILF